MCAGHSSPQAWSDEPASALGRVATPCLGAGAGRWTWEQRGSWTLDVVGSPGSPTYLQIVDFANRGSEENKKRSRWCGDDGSGELQMIIVGRGGVDSKVFHCHQGQQLMRCPGSRDQPQLRRNFGEHMHSVPVGTNYNVCLPTCKDHETSDSGADRLELKPSLLQVVPEPLRTPRPSFCRRTLWTIYPSH